MNKIFIKRSPFYLSFSLFQPFFFPAQNPPLMMNIWLTAIDISGIVDQDIFPVFKFNIMQNAVNIVG